MNLVQLITRRRDGFVQTKEELTAIAQLAAKDDESSHYQLSAWLMAAYFKPLTREETANLTIAMCETGDRLDLSGLPKPWLDKHSTGGVGDKTTIAILPILAACGLTMVKMSGKGLGRTGGTIDKLASIPGFRLDLSEEEMLAQAKRIGIVLNGQTSNLAPADKTLYKLRDTSGSVESIPLIVSSILSKKLAGGCDKLVLDVKCGSGSFCPTLEVAQALATELVEVSKLIGIHAEASITDMDQPLGSAVGNALEVREAIEVLLGKGPARFRELVLELAAEAVHFCGLADSRDQAREKVRDILESGSALEKANEWFFAQSGLTVEQVLEKLPVAPVRESYVATQNGWIARVDAGLVGEAVIDLGGGRRNKSDELDYSVGLEILVTVGDKVQVGQELVRIHNRTAADAEKCRETLRQAIQISESEIEPRTLFL